MENIRKLLEENEDVATTSSDENETDNDSLSVWDSQIKKNFFLEKDKLLGTNSSESLTSKKRNGEKRLPTRRPDPNVYNRNALLARENRRKKKVYLETIEKELHTARKVNRALAKALKRQVKIAQSLEKEKTYFENLVKNRSDLLTIANALSIPPIPQYENVLGSRSNYEGNTYNNVINVARTRSHGSLTDIVNAQSIEFDPLSDGTVAAPVESSCSDSSFPDFFPDLDNGTDTNLRNTFTPWDFICFERDYDIDNLISTNLTISQADGEIQSFINDHSYVLRTTGTSEQRSDSSNFTDVNIDYEDIGVSHSTSRTPPMQLLSEQSS